MKAVPDNIRPSTFAASFLAFVLVALASTDAFACRCTERINPPKDAEIGFWGTVEEVKPRGSTNRAVFKVEQVYHGGHRDAVPVYANRFHHDCGIRFREGESYVVYAYDFHPRGVATSMCWGTYPSETPITEEEYYDLDIDIPPTTKLEKKLRRMAEKIVRVCGHATRVTDAGFSFVLAPDGDPVALPSEERLPRREEKFHRCVVDQYVENANTPRPEEAVRIEGWYQKGHDRLPILLDQLPCGEDCLDWASRVRQALLDVRIRRTPEEARLFAERLATEPMAAARAICPHQGLQAAQDKVEGGGAPSPRSEKRKMMLLDCAIVRGDFQKATEFLEVAPNDPYRVAVNWAADSTEAEEAPYPIRKNGVSFPARWFVTHGPETPGKFRVLRRAFVEGAAWAQRALFLEALAESILADERASIGMRDLAALAYQKAAYLRPDVAEAYRELADGVDTSPDFETLAATLDEAYEQAKSEKEAENIIQKSGEDEPAATNAGTTPQTPDKRIQLDLVDKITIAIGAVMLLVMLVAVVLRIRRKN